MTTLSMPIGDPTCPWNGTCKQFCAGHYLKPQEAVHAAAGGTNVVSPPSPVILEASQTGIVNESDIETLASNVLLPVHVKTSQ